MPSDEPMPSDDNDNCQAEQPASEDSDARRAEERFIDDLLSRGEAVPEGDELPPGATHVIARDAQGRRTARRVRFTAF